MVCNELWHCVLQAVDIFAASFASSENRVSIMRELASIWAISDSVAEAFYPPNKPVIQVIVVSDHGFLFIELTSSFFFKVATGLQDLGTDLIIGRVTLQRHQSLVSASN